MAMMDSKIQLMMGRKENKLTLHRNNHRRFVDGRAAAVLDRNIPDCHHLDSKTRGHIPERDRSRRRIGHPEDGAGLGSQP